MVVATVAAGAAISDRVWEKNHFLVSAITRIESDDDFVVFAMVSHLGMCHSVWQQFGLSWGRQPYNGIAPTSHSVVDGCRGKEHHGNLKEMGIFR